LLNVSVFHPLVLWTYLGVDSGSETQANVKLLSFLNVVFLFHSYHVFVIISIQQ